MSVYIHATLVRASSGYGHQPDLDWLGVSRGPVDVRRSGEAPQVARLHASGLPARPRPTDTLPPPSGKGERAKRPGETFILSIPSHIASWLRLAAAMATLCVVESLSAPPRACGAISLPPSQPVSLLAPLLLCLAAVCVCVSHCVGPAACLSVVTICHSVCLS